MAGQTEQHADASTGATSVVVVVGNPQPASRTATAATEVGRQIAELIGASEVELIDLADLGPALLGWGDPAVASAKASVLAATIVVFASPTYKAAYTGLLKLFLDQFDQGALAPVAAVVPVMSGGGPAHSLAVDMHLRPVLIEIGSSCPTTGIYFSGAEIDDPAPIIERWLTASAGRLLRSAATI